MKKIPYDINDFERIIDEDYYYVDKTQYIKAIEDWTHYKLLVRPQGMGKTLFLNMLMTYYDINKKNKFEKYFGHLWIGKNPTELANKFMVLKLDFSKVTLSEDFEEQFFQYFYGQIEDFLTRYKDCFTSRDVNYVLSKTGTFGVLYAFMCLIETKEHKVYLFVDNFDNLKNIVQASKGVNAKEILWECERFYIDFLKCFRGWLWRILVTGILPVMYNDFTNGFDILEDISLNEKTDKIMGLTEKELGELLNYYKGKEGVNFDVHDTVRLMNIWYGNYYFSHGSQGKEPPVYNSAMVLRYLDYLLNKGKDPYDMVPSSKRKDHFEKIDYCISTQSPIREENAIWTLKEILIKGFMDRSVWGNFEAFRFLDWNGDFAKLFFYLGLLTFEDCPDYFSKLVIPNKMAKTILLDDLEYLVERYDYGLTCEEKEKLERIRLSTKL